MGVRTAGSARVLRALAARAHQHERCVEAALAEAEVTCRRSGQRLTTLRRRVLELVWAGHAPVKAYDLLERLRAERARAAPPTVYRALDFLCQEGLVHRIESLNAYVGCGEPQRPHRAQFLICRDCGTVAELDDTEVSGLIAGRAGRMGFEVQRETIEVVGRCAACRADPAGPARDVPAGGPATRT